MRLDQLSDLGDPGWTWSAWAHYHSQVLLFDREKKGGVIVGCLDPDLYSASRYFCRRRPGV